VRPDLSPADVKPLDLPCGLKQTWPQHFPDTDPILVQPSMTCMQDLTGLEALESVGYDVLVSSAAISAREAV